MNEFNHTLLLAEEGGGAGDMIGVIIGIVVVVVTIAGFWRTFEKAGKPGWGAIIPIYNIILTLGSLIFELKTRIGGWHWAGNMVYLGPTRLHLGTYF